MDAPSGQESFDINGNQLHYNNWVLAPHGSQQAVIRCISHFVEKFASSFRFVKLGRPEGLPFSHLSKLIILLLQRRGPLTGDR